MAAHIDLERLYRAAPLWAQNGLVSLEGWRLHRRRYGRGYWRIQNEVEQRWALTGDALTNLQHWRLANHLKVAAATPFWRRRFAQFGVNARASNPFAELAKLPILTKVE